MIDSIAFQINRHSNGRGLWLAGKSDRGDNQGVIVCMRKHEYRAYPPDSIRFRPIPPESNTIFNEKEMAGYAPRRISNSNKATDEKIIRISFESWQNDDWRKFKWEINVRSMLPFK